MQKKFFLKFLVQKIVFFGSNLQFLAKKGQFGTKRAIFSADQKKFDTIIFSFHLERHFELSYAPYLNVCGQGEQKSNFWAKNIMLWPKMAIFRGSKIFKKNSSDRPHRVLSNEVSYDPIHQRHQVLHILVLVLLILHRQYHDTTTTIITTTPESFVFKISS